MDRRSFTAAMFALFGGILVPAPIRERIVLPAKDPFTITSSMYWDLIVMKPSPRGVDFRGNDYLPEPLAARVVQVSMTEAELAGIERLTPFEWQEIEKRPMSGRRWGTVFGVGRSGPSGLRLT